MLPLPLPRFMQIIVKLNKIETLIFWNVDFLLFRFVGPKSSPLRSIKEGEQMWPIECNQTDKCHRHSLQAWTANTSDWNKIKSI